MTNERIASIAGWVQSVVLGFVAFLVYLATLSAGAHPGESALLVAQHMGLFPIMVPSNSLWGMVVGMVLFVARANAASAMNVLSAFCGAMCVALAGKITMDLIFAVHDTDDFNRGRHFAARHLAGLVTSVSLAFALPFWMVSTRAHPGAFDLAFLLVVVAVFMRGIRPIRPVVLMVFSLLYGVLVVEFATAIVLMPLFGVVLLVRLWREEQMRFSVIAPVILTGLVGLTFYLLAAWRFVGTEGYILREYSGFLDVVWQTWRAQYQLIMRGLPQVGWLIIVLVFIVPWIVALMVAERSLNEEKDWTFYLLHIVMTACCVLVLLDVPFVVSAVQSGGRVLVTPYALAAMCTGYVVAYWFLLPSTAWPERTEVEPARKRTISTVLGSLLVLPMLFLAGRLAFVNFERADGRQTAFVQKYVREVVRSMGGREWLVSDGFLDQNFLVAGCEQRKKLRVLSLGAQQNDIYFNYVSMPFSDPRLKNLAKSGLFPLLAEWPKMDPEFTKRVAFLVEPDFLVAAGMLAVPDGLVFAGVSPEDRREIPEMLAKTDGIRKELMRGVDPKALKANPFNTYCLRRLSMLSNNAGVVLEDTGKKAAAFEAYRSAREVDGDNVSALLNMHAMVAGGFAAADAEAVKRDLEQVMKSGPKHNLWNLSRAYGYVRSPWAFERLGMMWARSGQPGMAVVSLKRAMNLLPEDQREGVMQKIADLQLRRKNDAEGEKVLRSLLSSNPTNTHALVGMAYIETRRKEYDKALEYIGKAEKAGAPRMQMVYERAVVAAAQREFKAAFSALDKILKENPRHASAWDLVLSLCVDGKDVGRLRDAVRSLELMNPPPERQLAEARGFLAVMGSDWQDARVQLERAASLPGVSMNALTMLLRLDMLQARKKDAATHARRLLAMDQNNAFANYIMGSIATSDGDYDTAEGYLRKSLEATRTPEALNDLAWVLFKKKAYAEAEKMARESLKLRDTTYQAWGTLASILTREGKYDDAEKAFAKSLSLFTGDPAVRLHFAEMLVLKGDAKKAKEMLDSVVGQEEMMTEDDKELLRQLRMNPASVR